MAIRSRLSLDSASLAGYGELFAVSHLRRPGALQPLIFEHPALITTHLCFLPISLIALIVPMGNGRISPLAFSITSSFPYLLLR